MRDSLLFYRSFYEAAKSLNKTERLRFYDAILEYALDGVEPEKTGSAFFALYTMAKPIIDANNLRFENGKKGGRPTKPNQNQTITKPKPNHNQTITKPKPNKEEEEKEDNHVKENKEEEGVHPSAFVLADGSSWFPAVEKIQEFETAFPDVDVHRELLRCQIKHNAMDQRKNVTNIERYVVNWMINAQSDAKKKPGSFTDIEKHDTPVDAAFWDDIKKRGGLV